MFKAGVSLSLASVIAAGLVSAVAIPAQAAASTHYYRDVSDNWIAPPASYIREITSAAAMRGVSYRVRTDERGRIAQVETIESGQATRRLEYDYPPGARLPGGERVYADGALTGIRRFTRDGQGRPTREDDYTAENVLTGYELVQWFPDHSAADTYTAGGKPLRHYDEYYAPTGNEARQVGRGVDGVRVTEGLYDPSTGLRLKSIITDSGKLSYTTVASYDSDDQISRNDTYGADSQPYAHAEYKNNHKVLSSYVMDSHTRIDVDYVYDQKNLVVGSHMRVNGQLICNFTIERKSDGTIIRSLALGPDNTLWAEYPDILVTEVPKDGRAPAAPTVGIIHKTGDWY